MKDKKKLLLINPVSEMYEKSMGFAGPPLVCMVLAALTSKEEWDVKIVDERVESIDYDEPADLVGLTTMTYMIKRCYNAADQFRARGIPVILGGIHATTMADEASLHADCVVVGEVEEIWAGILSDFHEGNLKPRYKASRMPSMETSHPVVNYDMVNPKNYGFGIVQTSRGCPFDCEFCQVTTYQGTKRRYRPIDDVVKEILETPYRYIFVADDNFFSASKVDFDRAVAIMKELAKQKCKKVLAIQSTVNLGKNEEALHWAHKGGIRLVCLGLESLNPKVLKGNMHKMINVKYVENKYRDVIRSIQKARILVKGTFIYNNDEETYDSILESISDAAASNLDCVSFRPLVPYPGTLLFRRLKQENRLLMEETPENWERLQWLMTHKTEAIQTYEQSISIRRHILKTLFTKRITMGRMAKAAFRSRSLFAPVCAREDSGKVHEICIGLEQEIIRKNEGMDLSRAIETKQAMRA